MSMVTEHTSLASPTTPAQDLQQMEEELNRELTNPYFGVLPDQLIAFIDHRKVKWTIKPDSSTKAVRDEIMVTMDEYETAFKVLEKKLGTRKQRSQMYEDATKKVLQLVLEDFVYDTWVNDPRGGPVMLGHLAEELVVFLVDSGGRTGTLYSLTLQKLDMFTRLRIAETARKSGTHSAAPPTASEP